MSGSESDWAFGIGVVLSGILAIITGFKTKSAESIADSNYKDKTITIQSTFLILFIFLSIGYIIINLAGIRPNKNLIHGIFDWGYLIIVLLTLFAWMFFSFNLNPCDKIRTTGQGAIVTGRDSLPAMSSDVLGQ
jgi:hypothetical protein